MALALITGQLPADQRRIALLPAQLRAALAPRMPDLAAQLRLRLGMDKVGDPLPRHLMLRRIEALAARRDPPFG